MELGLDEAGMGAWVDGGAGPMSGLSNRIPDDLPEVVVSYIVMSYIVMAYIVMAYVVMAYVDMVFIVMAYIVMAYIFTRRGHHGPFISLSS